MVSESNLNVNERDDLQYLLVKNLNNEILLKAIKGVLIDIAFLQLWNKTDHKKPSVDARWSGTNLTGMYDSNLYYLKCAFYF